MASDAQRERERLLLAYDTLFTVFPGEAASTVLRDIADLAFVDRTTLAMDNQGRADGLTTSFNEGHRALYNKILLRITQGKKVRMGETEEPKYAVGSLSTEETP